jgi:hypothetical protein
MKKNIQEAKATKQFQELYQKYLDNAKLSATNLRNLLHKVCIPTNLPLASKMIDLQKQWQQQKHHLDALRIQRTTCDVTMGETFSNTPIYVPVLNVRDQVYSPENNLVEDSDGSAH